MRKVELAKIPYDKIEVSSITNLLETSAVYIISSKPIIDSQKDKILVISFFIRDNNNLKLKYRVFINKKRNDYITQYISKNNVKWLTGTINNILAYSCYNWIGKSALNTTKSVNTILKYFKVDKNPLNAICKFQADILSKRLAAKHKKELDYIDNVMKTVPKMPKNFEKWVTKTALINSRYIFYKYKKTVKPIKGYCTHCGKDVMIINPKHNTTGICPNCKSKIIYKSEGKSKKILDTVSCCLFQNAKGSKDIVIRYFEVWKNYGIDYKNPKLTIHEALRDFYNELTYKEFEFRRFTSTNILRWCKGMKRGNYYIPYYDFDSIVLYSQNLTKVLKGTKFQYSQIKQFATKNKGFKFPVYKYLACYKKYPFTEYFIKLGLTNLIDNVLHDYTYNIEKVFNIKGKNFIEILKLDKTYIPILQRLNPNLMEIKVLQKSYKLNLKITDEQIKLITKEFGVDNFFYVAQYTTINRTIKYINFQAKSYNGKSNTVLDEWVDYIKACVKLEYDMKNDFILFPKNLEESHNETTKLLKVEGLKICNRKIRARYSELSKLYSWEYKNYLIVVPDSADALIQEGQNLHHCVGRLYREPMANGETVILFLRHRDEPNKSFFTIEVKENSIKQFYGSHDCSPTLALKKIIDKFAHDKLYPQLEQAV